LREARLVLRMADEAAASTRLAASGQLGHLSIGFTAAAAYELLPSLLREFREKHPNVGLSLKEMVTFAQAEQISQGKLDIGLVRPSFDLRCFASQRLSVDRLVAALPADHALARKKVIRIEDFHQQPFIGHSQGEAKYFFDITSEMFRRKGVEPATVQSLAQPHTMLSMVRAGLGMAIVANLVRRNSTDSHIAFRELKQTESPPIEMWMIWRQGEAMPALENFVKIASCLAN
jgi:DNA-binding transcriptional LysR family regulator